MDARYDAAGAAAATRLSWVAPSTAWQQAYAGTNGSLTPAAGVQLLWPWILEGGDLPTATQRFEVITLAATTTVRSGVYLSDATTGLPDFTTRIDFGTFDASTAGIKDLTRTLTTLPRGKLLWLSILPLGGAPVLRGMGAPTNLPMFPLPAGATPAASLGAFGLTTGTGMTDLATTAQTLTVTGTNPIRTSFRNDS
jgi:hypothetical protein